MAGHVNNTNFHDRISNSNIASGYVKLNVGGTQFLTSRQTLLKSGPNFFSAMLLGDIPSVQDESGAYFIDQNPRVFEWLLDYLRTGDVKWPHSEEDCQRLEDMASMLCIDLPELHASNSTLLRSQMDLVKLVNMGTASVDGSQVFLPSLCFLGLNFSYYKFFTSVVSGSTFRKCFFKSTVFQFSELQRCKFLDCVFEDVTIRSSNMEGCKVERCTFLKCSFSDCKLSDASFAMCHLVDHVWEHQRTAPTNPQQRVSINECAFRGGRWENVVLDDSKLDSVKFEALEVIEDVYHANCELSQVRYCECKLTRVRYDRSTLKTCNFDSCVMHIDSDNVFADMFSRTQLYKIGCRQLYSTATGSTQGIDRYGARIESDEYRINFVRRLLDASQPLPSQDQVTTVSSTASTTGPAQQNMSAIALSRQNVNISEANRDATMADNPNTASTESVGSGSPP
eukprot:Clim_evm33s141 gene=Clim_evmTU33s141